MAGTKPLAASRAAEPVKPRAAVGRPDRVRQQAALWETYGFPTPAPPAAETYSSPYLKELRARMEPRPQMVQFHGNSNLPVHGWSPYVQGFSASFVQSVIDRYSTGGRILDPFAGCATTLVQAKLNGIESVGTELNPLLHFIGQAKLACWGLPGSRLLRAFREMPRDILAAAPQFLRSDKHFAPGVLHNLLRIRGGIEALPIATAEDRLVRDLLSVALAAILIDCSNLKRTPCLGYSRNKNVKDTAPWALMQAKVEKMAADLDQIRTAYAHVAATRGDMILANALTHDHDLDYELIITSPPYMNGIDYVMNYKIEMAWLGFTHSHAEAKTVKDDMVVCDNVSKRLTADFARREDKLLDPWVEDIVDRIAHNVQNWSAADQAARIPRKNRLSPEGDPLPRYRRNDMSLIVHKYFDDIYRCLRKVCPRLTTGGRLVLVLGDSYIADVYVPTDLIAAKIARDHLCLRIEAIQKLRDRRSGQIRSFKLRETAVVLRR